MQTLGIVQLRKRAMHWRRRLTPIRRYVVRAKSEWAIIYIDERNGAFMCQSSFGTYCYIWTHIGDRTLKQFLAGLNFDYFMGKTRRDYQQFDFDRSVLRLKEIVVERRRAGELTMQEARACWRDIEWLCSDNDYAFVASISDSPPLMNALGNDLCERAKVLPDGDSRGFWKVIWPEFIKQIGGAR